MKKAIIIILMLVLLSLTSFAQVNDYNDMTFLDMKFSVKGSFKLIEKSSDARIAEINTNLTFTPKDEINQKVLSLEPNSNPIASVTQTEDGIGYVWRKPTSRDFTFGLDSNVKVRNSLIVIDEKIEFPLDNIETYYTKPTEFIDIDENIKWQAQQLAKGEDDLYAVSFKVAEWVQHNIEYNLSTLTAKVVQKSSWVLKNKEGVCDEITNLFISMMRSLGIPARFVSGMAYTNTKYEFGPHAWAEVYFPGKGWVPFDITYNQYGWIDPSHIKIKTSIDSGDPAIRYVWKANDIDFQPSELDVTANLLDKGNKIGKQLEMKIKPLVNNVAGGSYVPIEVEIINHNSHYFPLTLTVIKAPHLIEKNFMPVLLKPGETKKVSWIAQLPEDLEENYVYKSIIEVEDQFHNKISSEIIYTNNLRKTSLKEAKIMVASIALDTAKIISTKLAITCNAKEAVYYYEDLNISCNVRNKGNTPLVNTQICLKEDCKIIDDIGISETKSASFLQKNLQNGTHRFTVIAANNDIKASDVVKAEVLTSPELEISNVIYNNQPKYNEKNRMEITIMIKASVKDLELFIDDNRVISAGEIDKSKKLIVLTDSSQFAKKDKFRITVKFKDINNKPYTVAKDYQIEVVDIPWYIRLLMLLHLV